MGRCEVYNLPASTPHLTSICRGTSPHHWLCVGGWGVMTERSHSHRVPRDVGEEEKISGWKVLYLLVSRRSEHWRLNQTHLFVKVDFHHLCLRTTKCNLQQHQHAEKRDFTVQQWNMLSISSWEHTLPSPLWNSVGCIKVIIFKTTETPEMGKLGLVLPLTVEDNRVCTVFSWLVPSAGQLSYCITLIQYVCDDSQDTTRDKDTEGQQQIEYSSNVSAHLHWSNSHLCSFSTPHH